MIQKIQLRGISRSPSDRMTEDGGCAESFNVITDNAEIAPMPEPQDITEAAGLPTDEAFEVLYIHKGSDYTNYICRRGNEIGIYGSAKWEMPAALKDNNWVYPEDIVEQPSPVQGVSYADYAVGVNITHEGTPEYVLGSYEKGDYYKVVESSGGSPSEYWYLLKYLGVSLTEDRFEPFYALRDTDELSNFCAIGNVFICTVNGELNYFLFIDGKYETTVLGMIEMPDFHIGQIVSKEVKNKIYTFSDLQGELNYQYPYSMLLTKSITDSLNRMHNPLGLAGGEMRVIRFSLVLYNNDEVYSQPILVNTANSYFDSFKWELLQYLEIGADAYTPNLIMKYSYESVTTGGITIQVNDTDIPQSIVSSVRVYSSSSFSNISSYNFDWRGEKKNFTIDEYSYFLANGTKKRFGDIEITAYSPKFEFARDVNIADKISNIVDFRLVREYNIGISDAETDEIHFPFSALTKGDTVTFPTNEVLETRLALNTELEYVPERLNVHKLLTYNQRLYATAGSQKETARLPFSVAPLVNFPDSPIDSYTFAFKITKPNTGESYIRVPKDNGEIWFTPADNRYLPFLSYPDSNCEKAYIGMRDGGGNVTTYEVGMKPWASVVGYSYAIIDPTMSKTMGDALRDLGTGKVRQLPMESVQAAIYDKLFVSEAQNPFIFPHSYSFGADVLGAATTTKALSTGQFGQFPLYVFTTDGIWAMEIASDGSFVSKKSLSRDVALSNGCITPIEQAIVFTTDKGVMMLTGSDIQNISPNMLGKHYSMDTLLQGVIDGSPFRGVVSNDNAAFMDFMRNVQCAYDYTGQRILFFNNRKEYQYVYKINTATWHKTSVVIPKHQSTHILNSYPDSYIATYEPGEYSRLLNLSATLETDGAKPMKGMIITRPFDLGYPDVRKVIKSIRIRGYYNRQDVKYILQGSMDGLNWGILPSLRSGSFKLFRLVIMTDLEKDERISWVDVDFDVRFNNRLR